MKPCIEPLYPTNTSGSAVGNHSIPGPGPPLHTAGPPVTPEHRRRSTAQHRTAHRQGIVIAGDVTFQRTVPWDSVELSGRLYWALLLPRTVTRTNSRFSTSFAEGGGAARGDRCGTDGGVFQKGGWGMEQCTRHATVQYGTCVSLQSEATGPTRGTPACTRGGLGLGLPGTTWSRLVGRCLSRRFSLAE